MTSSGPETGLPGRRRLAATFETGARTYAGNRPGYPDGAVRWLVGPEHRRVLDLGAGSGSLTAALAETGHRVVAAEPSRAMLAELLASGVGVPAVQSTAESLPFTAGSFDAVTIATAFHWFDAFLSLPQIAAVLRPEGRLALVWNTRAEVDGWPAEFGDLLRGAQPPGLVGDWGSASIAEVRGSSLFGGLEAAEFPFAQRLDRDGLIGLAASRSYVIAMPASRRRRLLDSVGRLFDYAAGSGSAVELPYRAQCWRCTRA